MSETGARLLIDEENDDEGVPEAAAAAAAAMIEAETPDVDPEEPMRLRLMPPCCGAARSMGEVGLGGVARGEQEA